jgi:hypothetical protein
MEALMRKVLTPTLVVALSLLLGAGALQAEPKKPATKAGQGTVIKIDPEKDCETVKTTVCRNTGTGKKCEVVDTKRCKMY